jgi:hypothetical protein
VRGRLLAAALGILVLAALLARGTGRGAAWAPFPAAPPARQARPPARPPAPTPTLGAPSRNLFEYADDRSTASPSPMRTPPPRRPLAESPASVGAPPSVRVVGLIRRAGALQAALVVQGEMTVVGKGGRAGGYTVLDVDDEAGVRLRAPGGEEMLLPPPPF